jgi:UDP-hydrolysing UDP-N-acetyl-D-glucosamine 2-epimerase
MSPDRRRVAVLTTGRQDYGILRSSLHRMASDDRFDLRLWVGGMHLDQRFGRTVELIRADGLQPARELPFLHDPPDIAADSSAAIAAVSAAVAADRPAMLVLLGDRTETLAAAFAALVARVPVVHLHGGEESEGVLDNACRHAITKLSHLHLVSHFRHAERVIQMGEDPANVVIVGAAGLDNLYRPDLPDDAELARVLSRAIGERLVMVTMHPSTLGATSLEDAEAVAAAMAAVNATYVITAPNSDAGGDAIRSFWRGWVGARPNAVLVDALGERLYWGLMRRARVVLGNSSSGIIEAPAAGAAVINVGDRQGGRFRYGQVTDVPGNAEEIRVALAAALDATRPGPTASVGGYPSGPAAPRIVEAISGWAPPNPPRKQFRDLSCTSTS